MAIGLLLVLLMLALLLGLVAWRVLRGKATESPGASACGRCGYLARGSPGLACPECGADYRIVGIIPAGYSRAGFGVWGRFLAWSLFCGIAAIVVAASGVLPGEQAGHEKVTYRGSRSGQIASVDIRSAYAELVWPLLQRTVVARSGSLALTIRLAKGDHIDILTPLPPTPTGGPWTWTDHAGQSGRETRDLDAAALADLLANRGVPVNQPEVVAEIDHIANEIATSWGVTPVVVGSAAGSASHSSQNRVAPFSSRGRSTSTRFGTHPLAGGLAAAIGLALWGYGSLRIARGNAPIAKT